MVFRPLYLASVFVLAFLGIFFGSLIGSEEKFALNPEYVTVEFQGGLGNQLFQIATAYAYSKEFNKTLIMDHTQERVDSLRKTYFSSITGWTPDDRTAKDKTWVPLREKNFSYSPLDNISGNVKLKGYFQSLKYFDKYATEIIRFYKQFTPPIPPEHPTINAIQKSPHPTVSMHIRRTDYVGTETFPVQSIEYYRKSIDTIMQKINASSLTVVVFSDDMNWCKQNIPKAFPDVNLVFTDSTGISDAQELTLMSECQHHIIANSSFSWWGAVFDEKPGKIVIAPKNWFGKNFGQSWQDLYCPGWIVV
jgi:hypothetical protein